MHTSETMRLMGIVTALAVGCTAGRVRLQSASAVLGRVAAMQGNRFSTIFSRTKYFMFFMMYPLCSGVVLCGINKGALAS